MLSIVYLFIVLPIVFSFAPDTSSFDAYGLKLAANDILLVESLPNQSAFFLRLAPYNYSLSCTVSYNDSNHYVYAVAVQRQPRTNDTIRFVFIGVNIETDVPFIGSLNYTGIAGSDFVASMKQVRKTAFPCSGWQRSNYQIRELPQFAGDESNEDINNNFFVVTVDSTGHFAYGFAKNFLVIYNLDTGYVTTQLGNVTWPDVSFLPHAVDMNQDGIFVVLGYIGNPNVQYSPYAYLLNVTNSIFNVLDTWSYTPPTNTSWQASITNADADIYSAKYDMSVSMNSNQQQVLLGIQIVNTLVLLDINRTTHRFGLITRTLSNGKSIGMGKTVGWLGTDVAIVLVNTYSFAYVWSSSQIFVYNVSVSSNTFTVTAIFPSIQQTLVPTFGPAFLSMVVTQNGTMVILDTTGNYYIVLPSPAGSFSDSSFSSSSSSKPCIAGTFAPRPNFLPCSLCPTGTTTNGLTGQTSCDPCANDTFCSLGAVSGSISSSSPLLTNTKQVFAYPDSPQSIRFDNILIQNMLVIHSASSRHCLIVSPLFWATIVIAFGIVVWLTMLLLTYCIKNPQGEKVMRRIKHFLKKADLIGEGEMVIGGLFSFAIIVLVAFAYSFSHGYFHRYPIEKIQGEATFACDTDLSNAQFSSGLMTTGIPPSDAAATIFTLLDAQSLTLHIEFVNTLFKCVDVTATQMKDTPLDLKVSSCDDSNNTLSIAIVLPSHGMNIQITLADRNTIGALHMRLEGSGVDEENEALEAAYTLAELAFAQTFTVAGRLLTQQPSCTLQLTKVINQTYPLSEGGTTQFNGIWLPSFSANLDQMFVDESEYMHATSSNTILSITIDETPYYMQNIQKPITDEAELIFTNLLFTIVCLEIFGLAFLLFKLILLPLLRHLLDYCQQRSKKQELSSDRHFDFLHPSTCRL